MSGKDASSPIPIKREKEKEDDNQRITKQQFDDCLCEKGWLDDAVIRFALRYRSIVALLLKRQIELQGGTFLATAAIASPQFLQSPVEQVNDALLHTAAGGKSLRDCKAILVPTNWCVLPSLV